MLKFYKKALIALVSLLVMDGLLAWGLLSRSNPSIQVLAAPGDGMHWRYAVSTDGWRGGQSSASLAPADGHQLRFRFKVAGAGELSFASADLILHDRAGKLAHVDWSKYSTAKFVAKCEPANSLIFGVLTFDDRNSKAGDFVTYRTPQTFFSCSASGIPVTIDLTRLTLPEWWFNVHKLPMALHDYRLDKVAKVVIGASIQSPRDVETQVSISEFTLHGRDERYITATMAVLAASLLAFVGWFIWAHSRALMASLDRKMKKDLPLLAYRQLSVEPYQDKSKAAVFRYIATHYTNDDLDVESVVTATGVNRNKLNAYLKEELGLTFSGYLNKLRLTEAARLLTAYPGMAVSEIAYSVGYANVPYFNKLFKDEYGCAPKAFRSLAPQQQTPTAASPLADPG